MIGVTQAEAVLTIELQRPERRNALNSQLVEELRETLQKASEGSHGTIRAIVPVSYTHLDVYKRQAKENPAWIL